MSKILEINNLKKAYNTLQGEILVLDDITIDVKKGSFTSIVGSSGCGKSTLLNIIAGLDKQDDGQLIRHKDLKIGYMLQDDALLPYLNVLDNATLGLKLLKKDTPENKKYVDMLLNKYGLEPFKNKYPNELSGGMKQRVA